MSLVSKQEVSCRCPSQTNPWTEERRRPTCHSTQRQNPAHQEFGKCSRSLRSDHNTGMGSPPRNTWPVRTAISPLSLLVTSRILAADRHLSPTLKGRVDLRILKPFKKRTIFKRPPSTDQGKIACMIDYKNEHFHIRI